MFDIRILRQEITLRKLLNHCRQNGTLDKLCEEFPSVEVLTHTFLTQIHSKLESQRLIMF